jgi:hypothetical protein
MTRNISLNLLALSGLLVTLLVITVMPGSSIMDLDIDVGAKVLAIYVAYMAWALLSAILLGNVFTACGVLAGKLEHRPSMPGGPKTYRLQPTLSR